MTDDILELKVQIAKYSRLAYDRNLVGAAGGNVSARCGNFFLITAGGVSLRDITPENIIMVDVNGNIADGNNILRPSKETRIHLKIYLNRSDVDCVIHLHPVYATAFSVKGDTIPMLTAASKLKLIDVPVVEYADPGSELLAQKIDEKIKEISKNIKAVLLEKHGIISFDKGLGNAFDIAELVEETAKIAFVSRNL